ncbi:MAG: hypothetical protein VW945_04340 [Candidatus Poseidoniales archaeon]
MSDDLTSLTVERVESYLDITRRARAKATPLVETPSEEEAHLAVMLRMADDYASILFAPLVPSTTHMPGSMPA